MVYGVETEINREPTVKNKNKNGIALWYTVNTPCYPVVRFRISAKKKKNPPSRFGERNGATEAYPTQPPMFGGKFRFKSRRDRANGNSNVQ